MLPPPPLLSQVLLSHGVKEDHILFLCLMAAPEGIIKVRKGGGVKRLWGVLLAVGWLVKSTTGVGAGVGRANVTWS